MSKTLTTQHEWVAISIQPVYVLRHDIDDEPVIFTDPDEPAETQYGCNNCQEHLEFGNINSACEGDTDADVPPLP